MIPVAARMRDSQGAKKYIAKENDNWTDNTSAWVAAVIAGFLFIVTAVVIVPILKRVVQKRIDNERYLYNYISNSLVQSTPPRPPYLRRQAIHPYHVV